MLNQGLIILNDKTKMSESQTKAGNQRKFKNLKKGAVSLRNPQWWKAVVQ